MKSLFDGLKVFIFMTLLLGIIYPYSILYIVNMTMPRRSAGSLIYIDNQLRGSKLIAQKFNQNIYFWPRPSSVDYNTLPAGGSHLGPISARLAKQIQERRRKIAEQHQVNDLSLIPDEMVCASASGIDPHISLTNAYFQLERVAKARSWDSMEMKIKIKQLIYQNLDKPLGRLFGKPYVNVLKLNIALDNFSLSNPNKLHE
ncbi:MAG: potassium-transporting ATPase subunit KdpC [Chlamydiales bacterium]|nr:potassium-transporting ATPase subunit KdpC [Chlamydiales bacterium]